MKIEFSKPFKFEDQTFEAIDLKLEDLTGEDMLAVNKQFASEGLFSLAPSADMNFKMYLAARASKQPIEFFKQMPAKEFANVVQSVSNFLML